MGVQIYFPCTEAHLCSHFMMGGGNILVLQQILGHASITDTMKYAHFSPAHLDDAIRLNPLVALEKEDV